MLGLEGLVDVGVIAIVIAVVSLVAASMGSASYVPLVRHCPECGTFQPDDKTKQYDRTFQYCINCNQLLWSRPSWLAGSYAPPVRECSYCSAFQQDDRVGHYRVFQHCVDCGQLIWSSIPGFPGLPK